VPEDVRCIAQRGRRADARGMVGHGGGCSRGAER
jgi:hypothetical protein